MSIRDRIEDAELLWDAGRFEGAFLTALVAVAATSRRQFPHITGDRQAFEEFLKQGLFERISVEYRGQIHPAYHIFYKWFRCELLHEAGLPLDIELIPDTEPGTVSIRAGGQPEHLLKISRGWFYEILNAVKTAPTITGYF